MEYDVLDIAMMFDESFELKMIHQDILAGRVIDDDYKPVLNESLLKYSSLSIIDDDIDNYINEYFSLIADPLDIEIGSLLELSML